MKRCPDCGTDQPDDAGLCSRCGRDIGDGIAVECADPVVSERRAWEGGAVIAGVVTAVKLAPWLIVAVFLLLIGERVAALVVVSLLLALIVATVGEVLVLPSAQGSAAVQMAGGVVALGLAAWLARTGRPTAWLECLIALALAAWQLVRGWRKLRA